MAGKKGKKYKRPRNIKPSMAVTRPKNQSLDLAPMGLPGFRQHLIIRPQYQNPDDPRNFGRPGGLPGQYKVVFTLSRPGFPLLPEYNHSFAEGLKGDSHLAITKPAYSEPNNPDANQIRIYAKSSVGNFIFKGYPNTKGFLGKIELESIEALHLGDAALKAHTALASGLSNISVYLDTPLQIFQMDITELRTGTVMMSFLLPPNEIPLFFIPIEVMTEEFRRYASLYRDALNSNSSNYQFLCYYKIIEGIRKRQERLINEAKDRGEAIPSRPRQIIPQRREEQIEWLNSLFPVRQNWDDIALESAFPAQSLGRKVYDVVDKELDPLRNRIAHAVLRSGEPTISIDAGQDVDLVNEWLPLTKCIARLLLKIEFPKVFDMGTEIQSSNKPH